MAKLPLIYTPPADVEATTRIFEEARELSLSKLNSEILDNEEFEELWNCMQNFSEASGASSSLDTRERLFISYKGFKLLQRNVSPKARRYLRPTAFMSLICGENSQPSLVRVADLFSYVVRTVWLERTRLALALYDLEGNGFLKEQDVEQYIEELIPTVDALKDMDPEFKKFYICGALRKLFFFLDPGRLGKIRIVELLGSPYIQELMDVRESSSLSKPNWFTLDSNLEVYQDYLALDRKRNGLLSRQEFRKYPKANLTETFVERLFQESLTYEGEMDYKGFVDVVLALQDKNHPASIRFFFRILDFNYQGAIDEQTIKYFYKDIRLMLFNDNIQPPSVADVVTEIFDMIPTLTYGWITLPELTTSKMGGIVCGLLIDKDCFLSYEFREQQLVQSALSNN